MSFLSTAARALRPLALGVFLGAASCPDGESQPGPTKRTVVFAGRDTGLTQMSWETFNIDKTFGDSTAKVLVASSCPAKPLPAPTPAPTSVQFAFFTAWGSTTDVALGNALSQCNAWVDKQVSDGKPPALDDLDVDFVFYPPTKFWVATLKLKYRQ